MCKYKSARELDMAWCGFVNLYEQSSNFPPNFINSIKFIINFCKIRPNELRHLNWLCSNWYWFIKLYGTYLLILLRLLNITWNPCVSIGDCADYFVHVYVYVYVCVCMCMWVWLIKCANICINPSAHFPEVWWFRRRSQGERGLD